MSEPQTIDERLAWDSSVDPKGEVVAAMANLRAKKEVSRLEARIAVLEHALRYASGKMDWLAAYHLNSAFSKNAAKEISVKLWNVQSGEKTSLLGEP